MTISASPIPDEAFNYPGWWLAIRDGHIIAKAADYDSLHMQGAKDTDVIFLVPNKPFY